MSENVSEYMLRRLLQDWGVTRIFGYAGDGIIGFLGAMRSEAGTDRPRFIQARHEEMAAFMACAHAKFTGEVGVCLATSGPGAIHLLNGLYDAKLDHQPVVAIVGQQARAGLGGNYQQEVDLQSLFKDVAHEYVAGRDGRDPGPPPDRPRDADRPGRADRRPASSFPTTFRRPTPCRDPPRTHGTVHSGPAWLPARAQRAPRDADLRAAAEILNAGEKVAILVGPGRPARRPTRSPRSPSCSACGVAKALLGKAVVPDDLPWVTGSIGLLGTKPSWDMMMELRHAADGRLELSLLGVPARGGSGPRRADRHRRPDARDPLPDGGQPDR